MSPFRGSAAFTERWQNFDFALDDGVATVTFSRPDRLNALTFEVYADLRDLVTELPHRGDARVLVLTGQGRGFCSGGDVEEIIGELQRMSAGELLEFTRMSGAVVKAMRECPLPIVAAVNGVAAGIGAVSQRLRHVQTGLVANYALAIALGMVVMVGVYLGLFSNLFR